MDEYKKEGVKGKDIKFTDNRPIIDMFLEVSPVGYIIDHGVTCYFGNAPGTTYKRPHSKIPQGSHTILKCLRSCHLMKMAKQLKS